MILEHVGRNFLHEGDIGQFGLHLDEFGLDIGDLGGDALPLGIQINCIAPGVIETAGWNVYDETAVATYPKSNPMMRCGTAWDVAEACAFLGSPAGGFITGELLHIAGGGQLWGQTWTIEKPGYFSG